jgi:hypothetical protein
VLKDHARAFARLFHFQHTLASSRSDAPTVNICLA